MKKRFVRKFGFVMAALMIIMSGCAAQQPVGDNPATNQPAQQTEQPAPSASAQNEASAEADTIVAMLWGDEPNDMGKVLQEYENRTKDTLNTKLNIIWTPIGDYANKLKLKLSAGEDVDVCFDAQWMEMITFIGNGTYAALDDYFLSDAYPGLKKIFDQDIVANNAYNGHTYGIPFTQAYGEINGFYIRKDLREKYGLAPISSIEDLEKFFDLVKENEPGMIPCTGTRDTFGNSFGTYEWTKKTENHIYQIALGSGIYGYAMLTDDEKHVNKITVDGDPDGPVNYVFDYMDTARRWYTKGYYAKEAISEQDPSGLFKAGKAAAIFGDTANYYSTAQDLKNATPGAVMEFYVANPDMRALKERSIASTYQAWNFACVPVTSTKIDRTMQFFDWMYSEQDNHDLFELGIEGVHWLKDGGDKYSVPADAPAYNFNGYEFTWTSQYIRYPSDIDADVLKYLKYRGENSTYYKSPLTGFTFDSESLKTEFAKVTPVLDDQITLVCFGMVDDPKAGMTEAYNKAVGMGLDKILEEAKNQLEVYLSGK